MKLGILGGSFNPVHLGHLFLAEQALVSLKLDLVVLVPAYCSPFKLEAEGMEAARTTGLQCSRRRSAATRVWLLTTVR